MQLDSSNVFSKCCRAFRDQLTLKVEAWPESKTKLNDEFSLEVIAALKWCLPVEK